MNRTIIVGSPRVDGRSAKLAEDLFEACIEDCPEDGVSLISVATLDIAPCDGCNACKSGEGCVISDDMAEVYEVLEDTDELIVVAPLYFAGPSAQLKALLDRFQPYFYTDKRKGTTAPATLHVIGDGHSPAGWEPLAAIVKSCVLCAGFRLQTVVDWTGKIDETKEITAEAIEYAYE